MKVVIPDNSTMTYSGPWNWNIADDIPPEYMPEDEAISKGYTRAIVLPVPFSVPKWAFLLILRRIGKEDAWEDAIARYTGTNADRVRAQWEASAAIERDRPTLDEIGVLMGLTPAQCDQVFRDASAEVAKTASDRNA